MFLIASFPRSGNHLVRFLIEYLTGRPTLGCRGNPEDTPLHTRELADSSVLQHVEGEPIGEKLHFLHELETIKRTNTPVEGALLIERQPVEALLSHAGPPPRGLAYFKYKRKLARDTKSYFQLHRAISDLPTTVVRLQYEALTSNEDTLFFIELEKIESLLRDEVLSERMVLMRSNFRDLVKYSSIARQRNGKSARDPYYYSRRADSKTLRFLERKVSKYAKSFHL